MAFQMVFYITISFIWPSRGLGMKYSKVVILSQYNKHPALAQVHVTQYKQSQYNIG